MRVNPNFEFVNVANDYMLIPVGEEMERFKGTVVLNEVSSFVLEQLKSGLTEDDIVKSIIEEYDVDLNTAKADVHEALSRLKILGIIYD